jgi:hypothetical protein
MAQGGIEPGVADYFTYLHGLDAVRAADEAGQEFKSKLKGKGRTFGENFTLEELLESWTPFFCAHLDQAGLKTPKDPIAQKEFRDMFYSLTKQALRRAFPDLESVRYAERCMPQGDLYAWAQGVLEPLTGVELGQLIYTHHKDVHETICRLPLEEFLRQYRDSLIQRFMAETEWKGTYRHRPFRECLQGFRGRQEDSHAFCCGLSQAIQESERHIIWYERPTLARERMVDDGRDVGTFITHFYWYLGRHPEVDTWQPVVEAYSQAYRRPRWTKR